MALSNIFREPRRGLTETLVGVILVGAPILIIDWWSTNKLFESGGCGVDGAYNHFPCAPYPVMLLVVTPLLLALLAVAATIITVGLHAVGAAICDALERRSIQVRPRQRY